MYEAHFGLDGAPFEADADPRFFFESKGHLGALAELRAGVSGAKRILRVQGDRGTGKSMLLRKLFAELRAADADTGLVVAEPLDGPGWTRMLSQALGVPAEAQAAGPTAALPRHMANLAMQGRRPVLLVDDAHRLTRDMLDQLVELQRGGPLGLGAVTVVIAGDASLSDLLTGPAMAGVRERIDVTCSVGNLDETETGAYIEHRLGVAGWKRLPRFDADAFAEIHRVSAGNPQRINALSHQVVLSRYLTSQVHVDAAAVQEAVSALQEAERNRHAQAVAAAAHPQPQPQLPPEVVAPTTAAVEAVVPQRSATTPAPDVAASAPEAPVAPAASTAPAAPAAPAAAEVSPAAASPTQARASAEPRPATSAGGSSAFAAPVPLSASAEVDVPLDALPMEAPPPSATAHDARPHTVAAHSAPIHTAPTPSALPAEPPASSPSDVTSEPPIAAAPLVADIPIEPITPLAAAAAAAAARDAARRRALHQDRPISIGELPVLTQAVRKGRTAAAPSTTSTADTQPVVPPMSGRSSGRPLLCVVGGQADHIKAAALWRAMAGRTDLPVMLMVRAYANNAFARHSALFDGLDVAGRLVNLGIGGAASAARAAELTQRFEFVLDQCQPGAVIVFDGSDAALSCGLVAQRKSVPVVQIGAGLRGPGQQGAADLTRKLTDELSDVLYTADAQAGERLSREGIALDRVSFAGNLLIDSLQHVLRDPPPEGTPPELAGVPPALLNDRNGYAVVVLHSQANLADRTTLADLIAMLRGISHDMPLIWPMHSRAREQLSKFRLDTTLTGDRIACLPSMPYAPYAHLLSHATCVITDSWNVQEEATALGIPCISVGLESECPITSALGSNTYVGMSKAQATRAVWHCVFNGGKRGEVPDLWDGQTGPRIAEHLSLWLREVTTVKAALGAYATEN